LTPAPPHHLLPRAHEGQFRADLYYRIGVLPLRLPPLRFRSADIPALAERILAQLASDRGRPEPSLSPEAAEALLAHPWPGNLRELRNELEHALLACGDG